MVINYVYVKIEIYFAGFDKELDVGQSQMALTYGLEVQKEILDAEIKSFFDSAPPLKGIDDISGKLEEFVKKNSVPSGLSTF